MNVIAEQPVPGVNAERVLRRLAATLKFSASKADRETIDKLCRRYHAVCVELEQIGADRIVGMLAARRKLARDGAVDTVPTSDELRQEHRAKKRALKERLQGIFNDARELAEPLRAKLADAIAAHIEAGEEAERARYDEVGVAYVPSDLTRACRQALTALQKPFPGHGHVRPMDMFVWIDPAELPQREDA